MAHGCGEFRLGEVDRFPDVFKVFANTAGVFHSKQFARLRLMGKAERIVAHHTDRGKPHAHCEASVVGVVKFLTVSHMNEEAYDFYNAVILGGSYNIILLLLTARLFPPWSDPGAKFLGKMNKMNFFSPFFIFFCPHPRSSVQC